MRIERDGHIWPDGSEGNRCVFCAMRIETYRDILKGIENNPGSLPHVKLAICPSIISKHFVGKCPTCGKEYDYPMSEKGETCKQIHCECNTVFLIT